MQCYIRSDNLMIHVQTHQVCIFCTTLTPVREIVSICSSWQWVFYVDLTVYPFYRHSTVVRVCYSWLLYMKDNPRYRWGVSLLVLELYVLVSRTHLYLWECTCRQKMHECKIPSDQCKHVISIVFVGHWIYLVKSKRFKVQKSVRLSY